MPSTPKPRHGRTAIPPLPGVPRHAIVRLEGGQCLLLSLRAGADMGGGETAGVYVPISQPVSEADARALLARYAPLTRR